MDTHPADDGTSSMVETPDVSLDQNTSSGGDTQAAGKRWNLRVRKPKVQSPVDKGAEDEEEEDDEDEEEEVMEEDTEEEEEIVKEKPRQRASTRNVPAARDTKITQRKRKAPPIKNPASKRKSVPTTVPTSTKSLSSSSKAPSKGRTLYDGVFSGKSSLKVVVSDWIRRYEKDVEPAMLELIQFFVVCCGCHAEITMEMFQGETAEAVRNLTENFSEDSGEYPLIMTGPGQKKFKTLFTSFIALVVEQCQNSIVYDDYMLDTLIVWLVGFTDSQVRAFRHTCTVACLKLLSALISLANTVNYVLDNTQRQVEAERKRQLVKRSEAGQAQLEKLVAKRGSLQQNKNELEDAMKGLFSNVFVHRYRDVRAEIRAVCISELGVWLMQYSVKFLADNYLKYIGWMLYDKVGEVRLSCLRVLESLYASNDHAPHLELFTARFKERLLSMRLDVDEQTAVTALSVLTHLLALDLLDAEESVEVCELIFIESRAISHAAGQFAANFLLSTEYSDGAGKSPGDQSKVASEQQMIKLIRFFCDVKIHDHAHYFVDSLWDNCSVLHDWEAMTQLLLDDKANFNLGDEEIKALIEIITCAVRRAAGAAPPAGRGKGRIVASKEKRALEAIKDEMSTQMMSVLPQLLTMYGNDTDNATNLVSIPQHFDLELYAEHRLQKHLEDLLTHLHHLTVKHVETAVLDECTQTFHYLMDQDFSLHSTVDIAFRRLIDDLVESFKQNYSEWLEESAQAEEEVEDEEESFSLMVSIRRLSSYYKLHNLSGSKFTEELEGLLAKGVNGGCSEKVTENALACLKLEMKWAVHELIETSSPSREVMRAVRLRMLQLFRHCETLIKFGKGNIQREAYVAITDLLVVFARQMRRNAHLASLVYVPEPSLQQTLQDYVMDYVINSNEDEDVEPTSDEEALIMAERLNDRRVLLAAFLRLAMFQVIEAKMAAPIWGHFINQYHNFGDLIRVSMNKCRESNPVGWYRTAAACLADLYLQLKEEGGGLADHTSEGWAELKELAKKFALSLGFDAVKVRQPLVGIHREGIMFALSRGHEVAEVDHSKPPPNVDFLLILSEFSHRLLVVDRCGERGVLPFLMKQLPEGQFKRIQDGRLAGWQPLLTYFKITQPNKGSVIPTSGGKGRKRTQKGDTSSRPSKAPRIETTPTGSEHGSEEGGGEGLSVSPPPTTEGPKTRGRGQHKAVHEA